MRIFGIGLVIASAISFDGSTANAAPVTTQCGTLVSSVVKTDVDLTTVPVSEAQTFTTLNGAAVTVTVPAGTTRCVKVLFQSGNWDCGQHDLGVNGCKVQAVANTTRLNPGPGIAAIQELHQSHEWVRRLGPGTYNVQIQVMPVVLGEPLQIRNWVLDVQILN